MGWILVTLALPLLAPLIALICMRAFPLPVPAERLAWVTVVKDGQLCWATIGFCVSGLYELAEASASGLVMDSTRDQYLNGCLIFVLVLSSLFAACGAAFTTPQHRQAGVSWLKQFTVLAWSLVMASLAASGYSIIHFGLFIELEMQ